MTEIATFASEHGLKVIEDCAQSHGARYDGRLTGTFGIAGCFSFYPTKNLGALGDAGAIVTDDDAFADRLRHMRNYGSKKKYENAYIGVNSQAGIGRYLFCQSAQMACATASSTCRV